MNIEQSIKATKPIPLPTKTVINLAYTSSYVREKIIETLKPEGLTIQQYNVLRILRGQQGKPANLSTIQERMVDKMSNTTRLVDKLVAKKLSERVVCPSNRRKVEITITRNGLELLERLDPISNNNNQEIVSKLSKEELELLNQLLDKLRA